MRLKRNAIVVTGVVVLVIWVLSGWGAIQFNSERLVPPYITVEMIERDYAAQISRLKEVALIKPTPRMGSRLTIGEDIALFNGPEILDASIERGNQIRPLIEGKFHEFVSREYTGSVGTSPNTTKTTRYRDIMPGQKKMSVLEYRSKVQTYDGQGEIVLLFDLSLLEKTSTYKSKDSVEK